MTVERGDFREVVSAWDDMRDEIARACDEYTDLSIVAALLLLTTQTHESATRICEAIDALTVAA